MATARFQIQLTYCNPSQRTASLGTLLATDTGTFGLLTASGQPWPRFQVGDSGMAFSPLSGLGFLAPDHLSSISKCPGMGHCCRQPRLTPLHKCPSVPESERPENGARSPLAPRCPLLPPKTSTRGAPGTGGCLHTHHPPHLGRHVVAELPFDRGLARLAGHQGPGHLHSWKEARAARAASLGQEHRLGRPPRVQVQGPDFHSPERGAFSGGVGRRCRGLSELEITGLRERGRDADALV